MSDRFSTSNRPNPTVRAALGVECLQQPECSHGLVAKVVDGLDRDPARLRLKSGRMTGGPAPDDSPIGREPQQAGTPDRKTSHASKRLPADSPWLRREAL